MTTVLGIDPGSRTTAAVVRSGTTCVEHVLVVRDGKGPDSLGHYLAAVLAAVDELDFDHAADLMAVEGLNPPTPHLGMTSVGWLMDTAQVLGAIRASWPSVTVVPPGKHGKTPELPQPHLDAYMLKHYPADLIGPRERGSKNYGSEFRHARSAWDVSKAAEKAAQSVQQRFGLSA